MKQFLSSALILSSISLGIIGCAHEATITEETKVSTPGGTTTVTVEKEVKKTGDNPPPVPQ